jgi:hypothetical protein
MPMSTLNLTSPSMSQEKELPLDADVDSCGVEVTAEWWTLRARSCTAWTPPTPGVFRILRVHGLLRRRRPSGASTAEEAAPAQITEYHRPLGCIALQATALRGSRRRRRHRVLVAGSPWTACSTTAHCLGHARDACRQTRRNAAHRDNEARTRRRESPVHRRGYWRLSSARLGWRRRSDTGGEDGGNWRRRK